MSVLDGELAELIDVVTSHYQAEALKNATNDSGDGLAGVA